MPVTCPTCNSECGEHDRFCWSCGAVLEPAGSVDPYSTGWGPPKSAGEDTADEFIPLVYQPTSGAASGGMSGFRMGLLGATAMLMLAVVAWAVVTRIGGDGEAVGEQAAPTVDAPAMAASPSPHASALATSLSPPASASVASPAPRASAYVKFEGTPIATAAPELSIHPTVTAMLADRVIDLAMPASIAATGTPAVGDGTGGADDLPE